MNLLSTRKPIIVEFLVAFSIVLIVRGSAIFGVTWSQDDFLQLYDPYAQGFIGAQFSMLRASGALVTIIVNWLGATHPTNGALWSALHAGAMVVFGLALRRLWIPGSPSIYGISNALIFALFPGQSNLLSYQIAHPPMAASYCLGAFGLVSYAKGGWLTLASVMALALALGYQTMLGLFLVAAMILFAIKATSLVFEGHQPTSRAGSRFKPVVALFGCLLAGVVVYVVTSKIALVMSGAGQSARTSFADLDSLPQKISFIVAHLKRLAYGRGELNLPANTKLLQLMLLGSVVSASVVAAYGAFRHKVRVAIYSLALGLILLSAAVFILFPAILLSYTNENPRILMATAVFWAGIFSMSYAASPMIFRRAGLILGVLIIASYAIITNSICSDFVRLNQRELLIASRMAERLAELPGYDRLRTVVVLGFGKQSYRDMRSKDIIWSALNSAMATGVLREASGEDFANPSPADNDLARSVSRDMPIWPHPGSTAIVGDVGIVAFGADR